MKRSFAFFVIFLLFFSIFAAETTDKSGEQSVFQQYQTFSWEPVPRARKYEVVIEDFKDGKWIKEISEKTKKTNVEILLTPGQKRISIISYNFLGRKASSSDWVEFIILSEAQPYLYDDYLKKSSVWNSPILRISHLEGDSSGDNLKSEDGDPENSFFVKGKNIFFEGTKFSLVPADKSRSGGKDYQSYVTGRRASPLTVVRRDYERSGVVVAYNADELFSGYYRIVAENPGGMSAELDILVFADAEPVFDMSNFEYDENFKTYVIPKSAIVKNGELLIIEGTGFTFDTKFTLIPSDAGIQYPFSSAISRERISLEVNSVDAKPMTEGLEVSASVNLRALHPGYYKLVAESSGGRAEELILFTDGENESLSPTVKNIKGSAGKSDQVTFEIKGKLFADSQVFTLVSPFDPEAGSNTRISMSIVDIKKQGKQLFIQGNKEKIIPGVYALIIENDNLYKRIYLEIDKRFGVKIKELTAEEVAEIFFVPTDYVFANQVDEEFVPPSPDDLSYEAFDFTVVSKYAKFCPSMTENFGLGHYIYPPDNMEDTNNLSLTGMKFTLDVLRFDWFIWDIGFGIMGYYFKPEVFSSIYLTIPYRNFRPFIGAGIGVHYQRNIEVEDVIKEYKNHPFGVELVFDAGITLLDFFQFRYSMSYWGFSEFVRSKVSNYTLPSGVPFFYNSFYIGATFPIRSMIYTKIPETFTLTVTRAGVISGTEYELQKDIKKIIFANGVKVIEHFEEMEILEEVVLPESLAKIGEKAFYNCENLKEISIPDGVVEIGDYAFAGCKSIKEIVLPSSIRKVSPTAFEGWDLNIYNQKIKVRWDSDDETVRDLGGVENLKCFDASGEPDKNKYNSSDSSEINFSILDNNDIYVTNKRGEGVINFESGNVNYNYKKYKALHISGKKAGGRESAVGIQTYDETACKYLKSGESLKFYMRLNGPPLTLYFSDESGNVRYSTILSPSKEVKKVVIPYSRLKLNGDSSSKLHVNSLDIGMFGIEAGEDSTSSNFDAYFFGFEVIK